MPIRPMGVEFSVPIDRQTEGGTDVLKQTVVIRSFADKPKNVFMTILNWSEKNCRKGGYEI
jgi:hypothetical protein